MIHQPQPSPATLSNPSRAFIQLIYVGFTEVNMRLKYCPLISHNSHESFLTFDNI